MLSIVQLCRSSQPVLSASRVVGARSFNASRQMITPLRCYSGFKNSSKGIRQSTIKPSLMTFTSRLCSSTPKQRSKVVGYWLLGCSGMVFTAVVLGGVTRLTESGLSMVTWRLLGEKLPTTEQEWAEEFAKYQQYPEFIYKNQSITLTEFKWIWWMEYAHRTWGRAIGAAVFVPAAVFWAQGYLDKAMKRRVAVYCTLVACQGLMGWYMVKSGLEDRFQDPNDVPRVSQYRLAAHLSLAFLLYAGLLTGALRVLRPVPLNAVMQKVQGLKGFAATAHLVKAMAFFTAISGAFVAGLDAGLVYNSFPKMGDNWIPEDIIAFSPTLRNFTENPTTVQFDHRILGTCTLVAATTLWMMARRRPLSPVARRVATAVGAMAWMQVILGISTLVHYVPTPLAATHQAGSLALLTLAVWLTHELKLLKYIPKVLRPVPLNAVMQKVQGLKGFTATAHLVKAMAFFTAISGAFVAGLDAGLVYNSFPKMGDNWIPEDIIAFSPTLRNFTENPTTVQFDHRILGTCTLVAVTTLWMMARRRPLSPVARRVATAVGAMAWMQVILGISTLVHYVPTPLAATHQAGSLALLTLAVWLTHELKLLKYIPK